MGWNAAQLPDLGGTVAVVTGGNSGIGLQAAKELAGHGARVVLACRNLSSGAAAAERISRGDGADVSTVELDLSSLESVRRFAEKWDGPLDLLVNNAGVMAPPRLTESVDGFELQFATNHLGHYALTGLLLPALISPDRNERARPARVVTISSIAHHGGSAAVLDGNVGEVYHPQKTYSNSKLANLLFAAQLDRELTGRGLPVTSVAAHPGVSATGLFSSRDGMGAKPMMRTFAPVFLKVLTQSAAAGARPTLYAATEGEPGSYTGPQLLGETRGPIGPAKRSALAQDEDLARRLWRVSEDLTGYRYEWPSSDA